VPQYVVYAVDEDYWMPLYVSIHSLLSNNRDLSFEIFVLCRERDERFFDTVRQFDAVHDDVSIHGIRIDDESFGSLPTPNWFTEATLYRFRIGEVLPLDDENVLYLDCDTIVDGSLRELFATDVDDSVAAATPEYKLRSFEFGCPVDDLFFNAGVMYINLGLWKEYGVESEVLERIERRGIDEFPVQEVLNPVLNEQDLWTPLHPKYNAMTNWADVLETETDESPVIIHYTGNDKPWEYSTDRLHTDLWWEYLERTPYRGYQPPDKTIANRLLKARKTAGKRSKEFVSKQLDEYPWLYRQVATIYRLIRG
jgi:lipopolysaccharide biosynthesis glycosyltransferase